MTLHYGARTAEADTYHSASMDSPKDTETPTEKGKRVHHFIWYLTKDTKDTESSPSPARGTNELFVPRTY
ncbi:hypothetical protein V3481_019279 [Fusarium oxysporum f. sp. vasinfectum]